MSARVGALSRVAAEYGITIDKPKRGSHWKAKNTAGLSYPLPCGNGDKTELDTKYVKGFCRTFGIDYDEFCKKL